MSSRSLNISVFASNMRISHFRMTSRSLNISVLHPT
jgi:hypothetical protein